ncbi:MAG: outer membrane beta-barrel protein [Geminicoccaceae bacterium]
MSATPTATATSTRSGCGRATRSRHASPFFELDRQCPGIHRDPGLDRNSTGFDALIGTTIDFTGVIFGEVSAGYTRREYDDNDLENVDGLAGNAAVTWNVTPRPR